MDIVLACSICFGHTDPEVAYVMMGMLAVPFLMVGGMFGFLYYRGVLENRSGHGERSDRVE